MSSNDLRDFSQGAAHDLGFDGTAEPRPSVAGFVDDAATHFAELPPLRQDGDLESADDADDEDHQEAEDDEAEAETSDEDAQAFWVDWLSPGERRRAEADPVFAEAKWAEYLHELAAAEADGEADGDDEAADGRLTGYEVVQMALASTDLTDVEGNPVGPAEWLADWVDQPPGAWSKACQAVGWPKDTPQPSHADLRSLGHGVQGVVLAESWEAHLAKVRASGRHLGG